MVKKTKNKTNVGNMSAYPAGDFLIRLKNATLIHKREVSVQKTKLIKALSKVLLKEKYLESVKEDGNILSVKLAFKHKMPILTDIKLVSKPSLRVYIKKDELFKRKSPSILILSTSKGIKSSKEALKEKLGGEVIAEIL